MKETPPRPTSKKKKEKVSRLSGIQITQIQLVHLWVYNVRDSEIKEARLQWNVHRILPFSSILGIAVALL